MSEAILYMKVLPEILCILTIVEAKLPKLIWNTDHLIRGDQNQFLI